MFAAKVFFKIALSPSLWRQKVMHQASLYTNLFKSRAVGDLRGQWESGEKD